ncbi:MAG: hypothetical protein OHK006_14440 [Thermodesulfovibrionales bacterium]
MRHALGTRVKVRLLAGIAIGLVFGILAVQASLASSPASAVEAASKNPFAGDAAAVKDGAKLFDEKCAECHGDGTGLSGPDLTDDKWFYGGNDAEVFDSIKNGRPGGMPSWNSSLSSEQIWKILTFIRSLRK